MSKIVCPYCFAKFDRSKVEFRCANFARCPGTARDSVLSKYWGEDQRAGRHIPAPKGLHSILGKAPKSVVCPDCHERTFQTICPECHNRIPTDMVEHKGFIISIIGARASGKTNYITVLIDELKKHGYKLGDMGITAQNIADKPEYNTQNRYENNFYNQLYCQKTCHSNTDVNAKENKVPLIYELMNSKKQSMFLVLYDTAGENFTDPNNIAARAQFLRESDAVLFLLDTFQVPYVREKLGITGGEQIRYNTILDSVLSFFNNSDPAISKAHFSKPMALVFTKIDAILTNPEKFEDTSIAGMSIEQNSNFIYNEPVSLKELSNNSDSLMNTLRLWGENNFVTNIKNHYKNIKYFGISALGSEPDSSNKILSVKPYRVLDPLVWLLHEFGFGLPLKKE